MRAVVLGILLLFLSSPVWAQENGTTDLYIQFFCPGGDPPTHELRFLFQSEDGMRNEEDFTDSNGRATLPALSQRVGYTVTVTGDGSAYGDTVYRVPMLSGRRMRVTVDLMSPPHKDAPPGLAISAASGYKPIPKVQALWDRAQKEIQKSEWEPAERHLRQAVEADAKFAAAANDLGALLMKEKKYPEAETVLHHAVDADPKFINALLNLGITLNHEEKYSEAIPPLREALRLEPRLTAAHMHLGFALVGTNQFVDAEHELLIAKKAAPENQILLSLYLGQVYARTGRYEEAIEEFQNYLNKAPNARNAADVRAAIEKMEHILPVKP